MSIKTEKDLVTICLQFIGDNADLSPEELQLVKTAGPSSGFGEGALGSIRSDIANGNDPLGNWFSRIRCPSVRRSAGAVYTPKAIVETMLGWLAEQGEPRRVVDPGAGSGRFIIAAGKAFPSAQLVAVELDPLAALMLRANLAIHGYTERSSILVKDFRSVELPPIAGITAFVGNPPYVRHHNIDPGWKSWYSEAFRKLGIKASALAGLHLHFFLKTRLLAAPGDMGAFITSSEWLDVNYGSSMRKLFVEELGGVALHVLQPAVEAFPGTSTTAAITCFTVGGKRSGIKMRSVNALTDLDMLSGGPEIPIPTLGKTDRWSTIVRPGYSPGIGEIALGEIFRVHRGQVTGANKVWIAESGTTLPGKVLFPAVTKAKELFSAGNILRDSTQLRRIVDIPADYGVFTDDEQAQIEKFLSWARSEGASETYIATHRKAWWSVGLRAPAPILCTYMARRPPQFTLNLCGARHINIAHGLYPIANLNSEMLFDIVCWLNENVFQSHGRTYSGGLTKFEPKEIERIKIPALERFADGDFSANMDRR